MLRNAVFVLANPHYKNLKPYDLWQFEDEQHGAFELKNEEYQDLLDFAKMLKQVEGIG